MLGMLGALPFTCSESYVFTFRNLKRDRATRWAEHQVIGRKPVLEYIGEEADSVSMDLRFDSELGMRPDAGLTLLNKLREQHLALPLVLGDLYFGNFVIESVSESHKFHDGHGVCIVAEASVSLKEAS